MKDVENHHQNTEFYGADSVYIIAVTSHKVSTASCKLPSPAALVGSIYHPGINPATPSAACSSILLNMTYILQTVRFSWVAADERVQENFVQYANIAS